MKQLRDNELRDNCEVSPSLVKHKVCWNCSILVINPKEHYPINATIFCKVV